MRDLYALFWKHVIPLNPRRVVDESGKKYRVSLLELLWIEKVLQIVFRLRGLGLGDDAIMVRARVVPGLHLSNTAPKCAFGNTVCARGR
jgi:hypothetical protein